MYLTGAYNKSENKVCVINVWILTTQMENILILWVEMNQA